MTLNTSVVHRKLEAKFKIGGIEATDLMVVLFISAIMNLFFGRFSFGPILIFGLPLVLFIILYFGKKGKPDGFLLHWIKFHLTSGELHAGERYE